MFGYASKTSIIVSSSCLSSLFILIWHDRYHIFPSFAESWNEWGGPDRGTVQYLVASVILIDRFGFYFLFYFSKERWRNRSLRKNSSGPALMTIYTQRSECTSLLLVLHEIKGRMVRTLTREDREWIEKCLFWPVVAGCGSERLF